MGVDFGLAVVFAIVGLTFILTLIPSYDVVGSDWYFQAKMFWVKYVLQTGLQMSSWFPVNAIANIFNIFLTLLAALIVFNVGRLILNVVSGGGTK